jgi:hypothetical protein
MVEDFLVDVLMIGIISTSHFETKWLYPRNNFIEPCAEKKKCYKLLCQLFAEGNHFGCLYFLVARISVKLCRRVLVSQSFLCIGVKWSIVCWLQLIAFYRCKRFLLLPKEMLETAEWNSLLTYPYSKNRNFRFHALIL